MNLHVDSELKTCIHEDNLSMALNNQMCQLTVDIIPHIRIEQLQITVMTRRPLKCVPMTFYRDNLEEKLQFVCDMFLDEEFEVPSLNCEVVASFTVENGSPRNVSKNVMLPIGLVMKFDPPQKDNLVKVNLNINRDLVPISVLFTGMLIAFKELKFIPFVTHVPLIRSSRNFVIHNLQSALHKINSTIIIGFENVEILGQKRTPKTLDLLLCVEKRSVIK